MYTYNFKKLDMQETKKEILNRLYVENNLTEEDVFKHCKRNDLLPSLI